MGAEPSIEPAVKYLEPRKHTERSSERVEESEVNARRRITEATLSFLRKRGINTERPQTRSECPDYRPCPFVSCKHHLYLDITKSGSIKFNFGDLEPWELSDSCALDAVEKHGDMTLKKTGNYMGLTRERIRQIQKNGIAKLQSLDEDAFKPASDHQDSNRLEDFTQ